MAPEHSHRISSPLHVQKLTLATSAAAAATDLNLLADRGRSFVTSLPLASMLLLPDLIRVGDSELACRRGDSDLTRRGDSEPVLPPSAAPLKVCEGGDVVATWQVDRSASATAFST